MLGEKVRAVIFVFAPRGENAAAAAEKESVGMGEKGPLGTDEYTVPEEDTWVGLGVGRLEGANA